MRGPTDHSESDIDEDAISTSSTASRRSDEDYDAQVDMKPATASTSITRPKLRGADAALMSTGKLSQAKNPLESSVESSWAKAGRLNLAEASKDRVKGRNDIPPDEVDKFDKTTVAGLKSQLKDMNQKVSGDKASLWHRLQGRNTQSVPKPVKSNAEPSKEKKPRLSNFARTASERAKDRDEIPKDELEDFDKAKVVQLRDQLKQNGQKAMGTKAILWNRLRGREGRPEPKSLKRSIISSYQRDGIEKKHTDQIKSPMAGGKNAQGRANDPKTRTEKFTKVKRIVIKQETRGSNIQNSGIKAEPDRTQQKIKSNSGDVTGSRHDNTTSMADTIKAEEVSVNAHYDDETETHNDQPAITLHSQVEPGNENPSTIGNGKAICDDQNPTTDLPISLSSRARLEGSIKRKCTPKVSGSIKRIKLRDGSRQACSLHHRSCRSGIGESGLAAPSSPSSDGLLSIGSNIEDVNPTDYYIPQRNLAMTLGEILAEYPDFLQNAPMPPNHGMAIREYLRNNTSQRHWLAIQHRDNNGPFQHYREAEANNALRDGFLFEPFIDVLDQTTAIWQLWEDAESQGHADLWRSRWADDPRANGFSHIFLDSRPFNEVAQAYPYFANFIYDAIENGDLTLENGDNMIYLQAILRTWNAEQGGQDPDDSVLDKGRL